MAMQLKLEKKDTHELFATPLLQQTAFWSDVKENLGFKSLAFNILGRERDIKENIVSSSLLVDDMLVLSHPVNRYESIAYVPYGPLMHPSREKEGEFIEELCESIRGSLPSSTIMVRFDLPWHTNEEECASAEELRLNWGTNNHNIRRSPSSSLPQCTSVVSLLPSPEEILARMHPKTRYNIRLAMRHQVVVREGKREDLRTFLSLYHETAQRNGIREHDASFFEALYLAKEDDARFQLLIAEKDGIPLASAFLTITDDTATYLYGASSSENRSYMGTYLLQYYAMLEAKRLGAVRYDLFGISPKGYPDHPLSGLRRFKMGFGGEEIQRMGAWDYPFDTEASRLFWAEEACQEHYHLS